MAADPLSGPGAMVRAHDPDRFLATLFAPAARREALWALYALNHELARAREVTREPVAGLIRLQWWREVVEGARRRHEVATPLGAALDSGALDPALLEAMIAGRERETAPIATVADWQDYLVEAHGGVAAAAAAALGADPAGQAAARSRGALYGGAGVLRAAAGEGRQGRCRLPEDALARHGLAPGQTSPALLAELAASVAAFDVSGRRAEARGAVAASLPVVLGRRDLRRLALAPGPRGVGDRLAVVLAGLRGHV